MKKLILIVLVLHYVEASSRILEVNGAASTGEDGVLNIGLDLHNIFKQTLS